jgi:hypothetical protein
MAIASFGNKKKGFEDNSLADELGICRTRDVSALAGGECGHGHNFRYSPCLLGQKAWLGV